jgi:hypothetical protein
MKSLFLKLKRTGDFPGESNEEVSSDGNTSPRLEHLQRMMPMNHRGEIIYGIGVIIE